MMNIVDCRHVLEFRVFDLVIGTKGFVDSNENVFVDRRRDQGSAESAIIGGQIGAASADRNAQWRSGYNHCCLPLFTERPCPVGAPTLSVKFGALTNLSTI